jgi:hypothetical protein
MNDAFYVALYNRLSSGTALINLLGGTAIYHNQAPDDVALPYVVFNWQGGGYMHDYPHQQGMGVVSIVCYSGVDQQAASALAEAVYNLLDRYSMSVTGWGTFPIMAEAPHIQQDFVDESGVHNFSCGDMYRAWLDKS